MHKGPALGETLRKKTPGYEQKKAVTLWGGNQRMTLRNCFVQLTHFTDVGTASQGGGFSSFLNGTQNPSPDLARHCER